MNEPSIVSLDAKINSLTSSVEKNLNKLGATVEKLADTVSNLNTVHVEINHLSEKQNNCQESISSIEKDIKLMNDKVITNSIQAEEYKHIKKVFMSFIVVAVLGGGYMTKTTIDNSSRQASAMAEIVKAIQEGSTKINKGK